MGHEGECQDLSRGKSKYGVRISSLLDSLVQLPVARFHLGKIAERLDELGCGQGMNLHLMLFIGETIVSCSHLNRLR